MMNATDKPAKRSLCARTNAPPAATQGGRDGRRGQPHAVPRKVGTNIKARAWYLHPFYFFFYGTSTNLIAIWAVIVQAPLIALFFGFPLLASPLSVVAGRSQVRAILSDLGSAIQASEVPSS